MEKKKKTVNGENKGINMWFPGAVISEISAGFHFENKIYYL